MLAVDTASLCAQIRVEVAGLRGLLALIEWARLRPELLIARRLQPFEQLELANVAPYNFESGRYCEVSWRGKSLSH